jgi:hypothetical protein
MRVEVERALADLEEVRDRLASVQRFRGYSSRVAAASGAFAIAGGIVQALLVPAPRTDADVKLYLVIWMSCLALALIIYYGNLALRYARKSGRSARAQTRTVSITILPAIGLGAVLSLAVALHGVPSLLPGVWYACYGLGLYASRNMVPKAVMPIAAAFGIIGAFLLLVPSASLPLRWWVMPAGFSLGQFAIGWLVAKEGLEEST